MIIIAVYINVGNMHGGEIQAYIAQLSKRFDARAEGIEMYFFPVRDQETSMECIYPRYVLPQDEYKEFNETLNKFKEFLLKAEYKTTTSKTVQGVTNEQKDS